MRICANPRFPTLRLGERASQGNRCEIERSEEKEQKGRDVMIMSSSLQVHPESAPAQDLGKELGECPRTAIKMAEFEHIKQMGQALAPRTTRIEQSGLKCCNINRFQTIFSKLSRFKRTSTFEEDSSPSYRKHPMTIEREAEAEIIRFWRQRRIGVFEILILSQSHVITGCRSAPKAVTNPNDFCPALFLRRRVEE